jgi:RimJ/RimL family protein N-acetyltransferase
MIRNASIDDINILVAHHVEMFREIYEHDGAVIDDDAFNTMANVYRAKLEMQLIDYSCVAWIVENDGKVIASCGVSFIRGVPTPVNHSGMIALLHSVYTEIPYRYKGYAQKLVQMAIEYSFSKNIQRIDLNASLAGKKIYEKLGFRKSENSMRLHESDYQTRTLICKV